MFVAQSLDVSSQGVVLTAPSANGFRGSLLHVGMHQNSAIHAIAEAHQRESSGTNRGGSRDIEGRERRDSHEGHP